jgi:hypothetical protein
MRRPHMTRRQRAAADLAYHKRTTAANPVPVVPMRWASAYVPGEDNVSELPPPHIMQAQVLGDELVEREQDDKEAVNELPL